MKLPPLAWRNLGGIGFKQLTSFRRVRRGGNLGQASVALTITRFAHNCTLGHKVYEVNFKESAAFPRSLRRKLASKDEVNCSDW
jgi:hypothetical protein